MTLPRIWKYHPDPRLPGECLERLFCNNIDPVAEGARLASIMRTKPPGKRGVLIQDLGGGASPDERHWWTTAGGRQLTRDETWQIYKNGNRVNATNCTLEWVGAAAGAYGNNGGPPLDFVAANVETMPGAFPGGNSGTEATWDEVYEWLDGPNGITKQQQMDVAQRYGAAHQADAVCQHLEALAPYPCVRTNIGAATFYTPRRYKGQLLGDAGAGTSCPMLYLCDAFAGVKATPESVLDHNLNTWADVCDPKICCLAPISWGGEDAPAVPGCRAKTFRYPDGSTRKFYLKPVETWKDEWAFLARTVIAGSTDFVLWHNDGKVFGPTPTDAECAIIKAVVEGAL